MSRTTKFTVVGVHPLLFPTRDFLIREGYHLVPHTEACDFCLYGASLSANTKFSKRTQLLLTETAELFKKSIPTLVLSSDSVYDYGGGDLKDTNEALVSFIKKNPVYSASAEYLFYTSTLTSVLILRPFNVYGDGVNSGVIHKFLTAAKKRKALVVYAPLGRVRSFLFIEDFFECVKLCIPKLLSGIKSTCNVGSDESISIYKLAKLVNEACNSPSDIVVSSKDTDKRICKLPSLDHIYGVLEWRAKTSLRRGLWVITTDMRNTNDVEQ